MPKLPTVLDLSQTLIRIPSVSRDSNMAVTDAIETFFSEQGFEVERLEYTHPEDGQRKASLVAKKGKGQGGLGFFSHSDTVPGAEDQWPAFEPELREGKLYGRGSCDMKGPLAATMLAAARIDVSRLKKPVYVLATADEEHGFNGAEQVFSESKLLAENWPDMGVVAEPSELKPIYSHKGGYWQVITAHGRAAHSSTDKGLSANFLIAPFLAEMADLKKRFMTEAQFQDAQFEPATNGFNMTLTDYACAANVTAAKTTCLVNFRTMPGVDNQLMRKLITDRADYYGFDVEVSGFEPFYTSPDSEIIALSLAVTGESQAITVPYGTEALIYGKKLPLVILGPGNIEQAHTVGEWIAVEQLERSVEIYQEMIRRYCC